MRPATPSSRLGLLLCVLALAACGDTKRPPGTTTPDAGTRTDAGPSQDDAGPGPVDAGTPIAPSLLGAQPARGESGGGTWVKVRGKGFVQGVASSPTEAARRTVLKVGTRDVRDFQLIDDTSLDLRTPPGTPGPTTLTLTNPNGTANCEGCFTYVESFDLRSLTPDSGNLSGGGTVTLTGAGFPEGTGTQVLFDDIASPQVARISSTELRAVVPRGRNAGSVDVRIHGQGTGGVLRRAWRYIDDTRITDIAPLTGPLSGGTTVTLTGQGFEGTTAVLFGNTQAPAFQVTSGTSLTVTSPPGARPGAVEVKVVTPRGTWGGRDGFTYQDPQATFTLHGVFPHVGARDDGTVTLTGQGLDAAGLTISFGTSLAQVLATTPTTATVTVPARGALPRVVALTATADAKTASLADGYTFRLVLSTLTPDHGPVSGGTPAVVTGSALPSDAVVRLGALTATNPTTVSDTELRFTTPPGGEGPQSLHVHAASDLEDDALLSSAFTYEAPLALGQVEPARGAIAGGTWVTVRGTGFVEGTTVTFGGEPARDIQIQGSGTLTCRTPASRSQGLTEVAIARDGNSATLPEGFTYFDPRGPGGLTGEPLRGTLNVTVLDASAEVEGQPVVGARVMLGTDAATPFQGITNARGQLTLSDPRMAGAQSATLFKEGYGAVTVAGIRSENLTVSLRKLTDAGNPGNPPPALTAVIRGRVRGFKPPRPLGPGEVLEARVFVAQASSASGPPFAGPGDRRADTWRIREEGGAYEVHAAPGLRAVYVVLGVLVDEADFEPYLLGMRRSIPASSMRATEGQDVVLDMHLDLTVPLTVDGPLTVAGQPAVHQVYAWLDLGAEGLIPHPNNWGTGTRFFSTVEGTGPRVDFPQLPRLDGASLLFLDLQRGATTYPQALLYHRQPGDLGGGLVLGPMLPLPAFTVPASGGRFSGTLAWATASSPPSPTASPDVRQLTLTAPGSGLGTLWTAILPGEGESEVTLPAPAWDLLRPALPGGAKLRADVSLAKVPRFDFAQWTYEALSTASWTAYALGRSENLDP